MRIYRYPRGILKTSIVQVLLPHEHGLISVWGLCPVNLLGYVPRSPVHVSTSILRQVSPHRALMDYSMRGNRASVLFCCPLCVD